MILREARAVKGGGAPLARTRRGDILIPFGGAAGPPPAT
jgi:hypothetical protein